MEQAEKGPREIGQALVALADDLGVEAVVAAELVLQGFDLRGEGIVAGARRSTKGIVDLAALEQRLDGWVDTARPREKFGL